MSTERETLLQAIKRETLLQAMAENEHLKPFVCQHTWVSGSSTEVYPYVLWNSDMFPQIEVQLNVMLKGRYPNYKFYVGDERKLTKIARAIKEGNQDVVKDFYLKTNDGSCPAELIFELF